MADCKTVNAPGSPIGPDADGNDAVCVKGTVTVGNSGGSTSGVTTEISTVNDTTWTALPTTANRTTLAVQNQSGVEMKVNFATPAGYVGMIIPPSGERQYNITDGVALNIKSASGSGLTVVAEELI